MEVLRARIEKSPLQAHHVRLAASVRYDTGSPESEEYWFDYPEHLAPHLEERGDAWLACLLPLAATLGEPLRINLPVDGALLENMTRLQEIWTCWHPHLRTVQIIANTSVPRIPESRRIASFFSGGVDSFYTALKHLAKGEGQDHPLQNPSIQDLFCVWGFDIPLGNAPAFARVCASLERASADLGLRFCDIATNIRETRWQVTNWPELSHGAALAAVALGVGAGYEKVFVPSTDSYDQLYPWGSHTLTDPLFSTSRTKIDHDGAEASRYRKIAAIIPNQPALRSLRVCWRSKSDENCGRCQKCLRTMLALELLGALDRSPAFGNRTIDLKLVRRIHIEWDLVGDYQELREKAAAQGRKDLAGAIRYAFWRTKWIDLCFKLAKRLEGKPAISVLATFFRKLAQYRNVN
jgi:hypothetical protein